MQRLFSPILQDLLSAVLLFFLACPSTAGQATAPANSSEFDGIAATAATARAAGKTDDALQAYRRGVEIRPDWEEGWWYLGTLQYDAEQYSQAIPAFKRVVELDSSLLSAWNFLGLCEFETGDYGDSLAHLKKGQAFNSANDPEIARVSQFHIALLLTRAGEFDEAFSILRNSFASEPSAEVKTAFGLVLLRVPLLAQEVNPTRDSLVQAAGDAALTLNRGNAAEISTSFRSLLKAFPNIPYIHYQFGKALASFNNVELALAEQDAEINISPASALPRIEISRLEMQAGHFQVALAAAREAVRLDPDSGAAHKALAQSEKALGGDTKSFADKHRATTIAESSPVREARITELYSKQTLGMERSESLPALPSVELQKLSAQANAFEHAGNITAAIQTYRDGLALDPSWDEGRWELATLLYSGSQYTEAIPQLTIYLERNANNGTAWAMMGLCEFELKKYENALIHLQRGNELGMGGSPQSIKEARYKLGILLNRAARHEEALRILTSVADTSPSEDLNLAMGMALLRVNLFPEQVEMYRRDLLQKVGTVAILLQRSKYDEAFIKIQDLLTQYSGTPFLHYIYGFALASLSQFDEAKAQLNAELRISPRSELPYITLASIALQERKPGDALAPALRATQLGPKSAQAHYMLGRAQLEMGNNTEALKELQISKTLAPGSPGVHFNLAKAYGKANLPREQELELETFKRLNEASSETQENRP